MILCKVTGTIVASKIDVAFKGKKLLIVQPINRDGESNLKTDILAIDTQFGAGIGDVVMIAKEGAVVSQMTKSKTIPANAIILGVIDDWHEPT